MAVIVHKSTYMYLDHWGHLLRIFFKIVYRARGRFDNLRILGSGEAVYDFEIIFSKYLLFATLFKMAKGFLKKWKKLQKYFGFRTGSVLFVHPVVSWKQIRVVYLELTWSRKTRTKFAQIVLVSLRGEKYLGVQVLYESCNIKMDAGWKDWKIFLDTLDNLLTALNDNKGPFSSLLWKKVYFYKWYQP